jgi:hypothetical protein
MLMEVLLLLWRQLLWLRMVVELQRRRGNAEFSFWDGARVAPLHEQKESGMLEYVVIVFAINVALNMMGVFQ